MVGSIHVGAVDGTFVGLVLGIPVVETLVHSMVVMKVSTLEPLMEHLWGSC